MKRYLVTIFLPKEIDEKFMAAVPAHRYYINELIDKDIVLSYAVNMQRSKGYLFLKAASPEEATLYMEKSPLNKFVSLEVEELFVYDSINVRFPKLVMN